MSKSSLETSESLAIERVKWLESLGRVQSCRQGDGGARLRRMGALVACVARAIGLSEHESDVLRVAAPLHDIGMSYVPDRIIHSPGVLTEADRDTMRRHTEVGAAIIGEHRDEFLETARLAALTHHERWDGGGYPHGLSGKKIPLVGRITALCDVFDSMLSPRAYRPAYTPDETRRHIAEIAGLHFDPKLAGHFQTIFPELLEIRRADTG